MATHTTYYNLTKPAQNDKVNIGVLNDNADIIDTALHNKVNNDDTQNITTSADKCMMSDGVTSVEDALDEVTNRLDSANIQTSVNISSYSSSSNLYTCPSDGYIRIAGSSGAKASVYLMKADNSNNFTLAETNANFISVFVRKGAKIFVQNVSSASFISL